MNNFSIVHVIFSVLLFCVLAFLRFNASSNEGFASVYNPPVVYSSVEGPSPTSKYNHLSKAVMINAMWKESKCSNATDKFNLNEVTEADVNKEPDANDPNFPIGLAQEYEAYCKLTKSGQANQQQKDACGTVTGDCPTTVDIIMAGQNALKNYNKSEYKCEEDKVINGNDMYTSKGYEKQIKTRNIEECKRHCDFLDGCVGISYEKIDSDNINCIPKSSKQNMGDNDNYTTCLKKNVKVSPVYNSAYTIDKCKFIAKGKNMQECIRICSNINDCNTIDCSVICDQCKDEDKCEWLRKEPEICKFVPFGRDRFNCIDNCVESKNCDYMGCKAICDSCNDHRACPWVEITDTDKDDKTYKEFPDEVIDKDGKPSPPKIKISSKWRKVIININKPYEGNTPIESYVLFLFKTYNKSEGINITQTRVDGEITTYIFDDLDPNVIYSIGARAKNSDGISKMSKIQTFKPNTKKMSVNKLVVQDQTDDLDMPKNRNYLYCN